MSADLEDEALKSLGLHGIAEIIGYAHRLIDAGVEREIIAGWLDNAAEAFSATIDIAVRELRARDNVPTLH